MKLRKPENCNTPELCGRIRIAILTTLVINENHMQRPRFIGPEVVEGQGSTNWKDGSPPHTTLTKVWHMDVTALTNSQNHHPRYMDMNMDIIAFQNEAEKVQHESAMEALSQQFPEEEDLVRQLYLQKLKEYMPEATIRTFVSIFVVREIKGTLNHKQSVIH